MLQRIFKVREMLMIQCYVKTIKINNIARTNAGKLKSQRKYGEAHLCIINHSNCSELRSLREVSKVLKEVLRCLPLWRVDFHCAFFPLCPQDEPLPLPSTSYQRPHAAVARPTQSLGVCIPGSFLHPLALQGPQLLKQSFFTDRIGRSLCFLIFPSYHVLFQTVYPKYIISVEK